MHNASMAVLLWAVTTGMALADRIAFDAHLKPSAEVPPTTSKGTGTVEATLDIATKMLQWNLTYSDLTGPATAAHFHGPAPVGQNAGVQVPVDVPKAAQGSAQGSAMLTDTQINDLETGKWYFNLHTAQYKAGEIRGQLSPKN